MPSAAGSTAKPASSSERTISPHASPAAAGSGSTSTSRGHVASASPRRICGRTPAASAAAVTGPSSGSPPGSGARAAGRPARAGVRRSAAFSASPGMERQAITGTYVLAERTFACKHAIEGDPMLKLALTMSLDGYAAGPDQTLDEPLGAGGMRLHEWVFGLESWRGRHRLEGGVTNRDSEVLE